MGDKTDWPIDLCHCIQALYARSLSNNPAVCILAYSKRPFVYICCTNTGQISHLFVSIDGCFENRFHPRKPTRKRTWFNYYDPQNQELIFFFLSTYASMELETPKAGSRSAKIDRAIDLVPDDLNRICVQSLGYSRASTETPKTV